MGFTKKGSAKCHNKSAKLIKKRIKETINTTTMQQQQEKSKCSLTTSSLGSSLLFKMLADGRQAAMFKIVEEKTLGWRLAH